MNSSQIRPTADAGFVCPDRYRSARATISATQAKAPTACGNSTIADTAGAEAWLALNRVLQTKARYIRLSHLVKLPLKLQQIFRRLAASQIDTCEACGRKFRTDEASLFVLVQVDAGLTPDSFYFYKRVRLFFYDAGLPKINTL